MSSAESAATPWRKVHRITPLLNFWGTILAAISALMLNISGSALSDIGKFIRDGHLWIPLAVIGVLVLICGLVWLISQIWWREIGYQLGVETLQFKHGVISKEVRTARYDRVEAVDLVEPLIPRLFGLAEVVVETAGGKDSALKIRLLNKSVAENLREEILDRVHGNNLTAPKDPTALTEADLAAKNSPFIDTIAAAKKATEEVAAEDVLIPPIPLAHSLLSLISIPRIVFVLLVVVMTYFSETRSGFILVMVIGLMKNIWDVTDKFWQFQAYWIKPNNILAVSYGVANKRKQTIPLHRIHAVEIHQPVLWRIFKWWQIRVDIAGYGNEIDSDGTTLILPVGNKEQADKLLAAVNAVPQRPAANPVLYFHSPKRAHWFSPLSAAKQWVILDPETNRSTVSTGWAHRRISSIDISHIQEITFRQNLIQRKLKLATVEYHLVSGPVKMLAKDLEEEAAWHLLTELRSRKLPPITTAQ
ncbi:PH domain-containing protein [Corynebacterium caspium]|uniref:PH domain-containing protein n=1 Tax=Corynebacterium caspium TaxID=234828 RepID=UPI00036AF66F|nr:PH domain-containing protein [Corynebacterium caspium]WKD59770.1 Bacterial membrane flanked domain protein [Corynebacterium caspium DSM 44850]